MSYQVNPLTEHMGAEVVGLKLHPNMSQDEIKQLENLILENKVVVFRDQLLTPEEQIKTCGQFGDIEPHPLKSNTCPYSEMTIVSNVNEEGEALGYPGPAFHLWHSDMCYEPQPPKFSFLYAERIPEIGGNTLFANTQKAYDDLEPSLKKTIDNKQAVFGLSEALMARCHQRNYEINIDKCDRKLDYVHPVVRQHPITKKRSIFVNWTHTDKILDMDEQESQALMDELFSHYTQAKYVYSHQYHLNDLIVWDNSSTMHTGDGTITIEQPRIMRRVIVRF